MPSALKREHSRGLSSPSRQTPEASSASVCIVSLMASGVAHSLSHSRAAGGCEFTPEGACSLPERSRSASLTRQRSPRPGNLGVLRLLPPTQRRARLEERRLPVISGHVSSHGWPAVTVLSSAALSAEKRRSYGGCWGPEMRNSLPSHRAAANYVRLGLAGMRGRAGRALAMNGERALSSRRLAAGRFAHNGLTSAATSG
jgi:hypothetical protein